MYTVFFGPINNFGENMKKKLLILILTILTACCLCLIAGCSIFGDFDFGGNGNGGYDDTPPPSSTGGSTLKAPESVKLNMPLKTLYIADCSESGVTFYSVTQEYGKTKNSLGNFSAKDKEVQDGFFEMPVARLTETDEFDIVVYCNSTASLSGGVSKAYTFKNVGGITYDEEHCTFDSDTGLFTWTDMQDATGYRLELGYNNYQIVDKPQVIVDKSISSFSVTPLFDVYKFGSAVTIYLDLFAPAIQYNAYAGEFIWSQTSDKYKVEITENGKTSTWELEEEKLPFIPSSDSVTVKITTTAPLRRPCVTEVTYDVLTPVTGVSVGIYTCELTWNAVGAYGYNLILEYEDGRREFKETTEPKLALNKNNTGKITAKILPAQYYTQNPSILLYANFDFTVLTGVNALTPSLSLDGDRGKLTVEIPKEEEFVTGYTVTLKQSALNSQTVEIAASDSSVSAELDLPKNKLLTLTILRTIGEGDGHYCFTSTASLLTESYYRQILYADAPEVTMIDKNATYLSNPAMIVQVDIPEELEGISGLNLTCNYDSFLRTAYMQSGTQFTIPITKSSATLQIKYSPTNSSTTLFKGSFEKTVVRLNSVDISADSQKLSWQSVDGAAEYRVEEADGGDYYEVYSGALTQYMHGVNSVGEWSYRVIAKSNDPFVLDSEADECTVTKLEKPTVSMDIFGELKITSPDTTASVLTLLNGVAKELSKDNLRAVLTNGDSATLTARSVKESTEKAVFIDSDDTDDYTLHRIGDLDQTELDIQVDAALNKVSWNVPQAEEYLTRLYYKSPTQSDYSLARSFTGTQTYLPGNEVSAGQFRVEVKPANRSVGNNLYIYLGDYIAGYFQKDGIVDITPLEDGSGFALDSYIFSTETVAGWKVATPGLIVDNTYLFDFGDDIVFTQNQTLMDDILGRYTGNNNLTFSVNYSAAAEAALSQSKTLKADEFKITYNLIQSAASSNFKGSYSYVDRQDAPTAPAQARVVLAPAQNEVLSAAERYTVVYKSKAVGANNSTATLVSETLGTELLVPVGNERVTKMFRLGIESNRFIKEGGKINFYRSSKETTDDTWYEFSAQAMYEAALTVLGSTTSNGKMTISFNLSFANHTPINYESFYLEYRADDGTWQPVLIDGKINALVSGKSSFDLQFDQPNDIAYFPGKIIQIRVKSGSCSYSLTTLEESDWTYLTLTVPRT